MAGSIAPNLLGTNDADSLLLGRGVLYLAELGANDSYATANWRDVGNVTAFQVNQTTEELKHQSSRSGLKVTDKKIVLSQEIGFSITMDHFNAQNFALLLSATRAVHTNPAIAGVAEQVARYTDVVLGDWYDLVDATGNRAYGVDAADLLLEKNDAVDVALVLGTDYELNLAFGMFRLLPTAVNIAAGDDVNVTITLDATAPVVNEIRALQDANQQFAVKFIGVNPADDNKEYEVVIHKTTLTPDGDTGLISDEFATMTFKGVAEESGYAAVADSPYLTVREHAES
jgi:hypothetical protein